MAGFYLDCAGVRLDLGQPVVMGVLNVTPDSFSDGGLYHGGLDKALARAEEMTREGAALIDVGGESTRPGATPVTVQEELDRVIPVVEALARRFNVVISVDTRKPAVMREAIRAGAGLINDVSAARAPEAVAILAAGNAAVCLMHMRGEPATMQDDPHYDDVVTEVKDFLAARLQVCLAGGIGWDRIAVDPGFGFGKTLVHNLLLLKNLNALRTLGVPLLVGLSRKSMIGKLLNVGTSERLPGSLAAAVIAAWQGARIIRAHDVGATVQALRVCAAVTAAE